MPNYRSLTLCFAVAAVLLTGPPLWSQSVPPTQQASLERLHLKGETQLSGMVLEESPRGLEFLEINQPPGKPTFAVIHNVPKDQVSAVERVSSEDRRRLERLVDQIRNRTQIRAAEKDSLELTTHESEILETDEAWRYEGEKFILLSALDESVTRSLAVRAQQIFQAYEHWLPPKRQPKGKVQIVLFGSLGNYSAYLKEIGLQVDNPAIYVPHTNQVLIGSELQAFRRRLEVVQQQHATILAHWDSMAKSLPNELNQLARRLKEQGWSPDEIATEAQARREAWQRDYQQKLGLIQTTDRRNDAALQALIDQTTRHLCHEAFHAYVETFLYPHDEFDVPVWLNEGLAQLFEHSQFENGTFRVDQPPRALLTHLQNRLRRDDGLSLQRMLQTEAGSFLLFENLHRSRLDYDVAWGLAWYLVFQKDLFAAKHLDRLVQPRSEPPRDVEQVFNQPVSQLQSEWTDFMLQLGT